MPTPDDFINITGAPVPGVATPTSMLPPAPPVIGAPQLDIPDYSQGAPPPPAAPVAPGNWQPSGAGTLIIPETQPGAPGAPVAPPAQPAAPTQFVSRPPAAASNPADLLKPVGSISTGTQTTTTRTDLGKAGQEALRAQEDALKSSANAAEQTIQYEREKADLQAAAAAAKAEAAVKFDADIQAKRTAESDRAKTEAAALMRDQEDYAREANNISGDRWWQEQSTGKKIGGLLSIALSGIGQVFQAKAGNVNAPNAALAMIQTQVDRDIDAQKTRLAAKERGIRIKESAYSRARENGANEIQASLLAKDAGLGQIDRELGVKLAGIEDKAVQARGQALRAGIEQERAKIRMDFARETAVKSQTTTGSRPVLGLEVAQLRGAQNAAEQEAYRQKHGLLKKNPELAVGDMQAKTPAAFKEWTERLAAQEPAERAVKVLESTKGRTWDRLDPARQAVLDDARAQVAAYLKSPAGRNLGSAMTETEKDMFLNPSIPTDTVWNRMSGRMDAVTKALGTTFRDNRKTWASLYGGRTE